jgi:hypothetical protein
LAGQSTPQSNNPAYLAGGLIVADGQVAYLEGTEALQRSSVSAFIPVAGDFGISAVSAFIYGEVVPDYSLEGSHILVYNLNGSFIRTHKMSGSFIDDYDLWGSTK